jgi:hypothetical protein
MTLVGRAQLDHPALGAAGGSALHASIESIYTNIGNDLAARYDTAASIANSAVTTFTHNFGVQFADLKVLLYTGTHPNLVRVADPTASGWVIAANGGNLKTQIDVTAPSSGGPHTFAVITMQSRGAEKLTDLDDINTTAPIDGQFLIYDTATSKWIPAYLKYKSETAAIASNTLTPTTGANVQRITSGAADLQMVASPVAGKLYVLVNETGTDFLLKNDTGGTAANRIYTGTGVDLTLKNQAAITLIYNSGLSRWIVAGGSGGGGLATELKSTTFTATAGKHYLVDNSASAFTGTLPAGSAGTVIRFSDNSRVWASRNFTIAPASGETIDGLAANETLVCDVSGAFVQVMWNGTKWIVDTNGFAASISSGSLSGGQGLGKKNYIGNPNNATNWVTGGSSLTVTTETSSANIPNQITQSTALAFTRVSGTTGYGGFRFEMDRSDYSKPFEINIDQKSAFTTEGYQIQAWAGSVSGTYGTQLTVANANLTGLTGSHIARCDMPGSATPFIEFRIVATGAGGTAPFYANNIYFGPGLTSQSFAGGDWQDYSSPTTSGFGTITSDSLKYVRLGPSLRILGRFTTGTVSASAAQITLPLGLTVGLTGSGNPRQVVGSWWHNNTTTANPKRGVIGAVSGDSYVSFSLDDYTGTTSPFATLAGNQITGNSVVIGVDFTIPIASWAGNGILNVGAGAQEEYVSSTTGTWDAPAAAGNTVYGPAGSPITGSLGAARTKVCRLQYPLQATDRLQLQYQIPSTGAWIDEATTNFQYTNMQAVSFGGLISAATIGSTDITVSFSQYAIAGTTYNTTTGAGNYSSALYSAWRIVRYKSSSPVGFGLAGTDGSSGLYMAGRAPGLATGAAIASGYVGETKTWTSAPISQSLTTTVADWTNATITLTAGVWLVNASVMAFYQTGAVSGNNGYAVVNITDSSNAIVQEMEKLLYAKAVSAVSNLAEAPLHFTFVANVPTSTTYKIRVYRVDAGGTGSGSVENSSQQRSQFFGVRIA